MENQSPPTQKYKFFQAPFLAFFKKEIYADAATNWTGLGLVYLLFVVSIAWLITAIALDKPFILVASNKNTEAIMNQFPKMKLAEGKLSIDKPYPYMVIDPETKNDVMVFVKERAQNHALDTDPPLIVTETALLAKGSDLPLAEFSNLSAAAPNLEFTGAHIMGILSSLALWTPIAIFFVGILPVWLANALQMIIFGGIALFLCNTFGTRISYPSGLRVAAIAMSPVIIISSVLTALQGAGVQNLESYVFPWVYMSVTSMLSVAAMSTGLVIMFLLLAAVGIKCSNNKQSAAATGAANPPPANQ